MIRRSIFFFGFCLLTSLLTGCAVDEVSSAYRQSNQYVNDWISKTMETYYYWEDKMPSVTDKLLSPDAYFETLLYKYDATKVPDGDRFSWIQKDYTALLSSLSGVEAYEIGFDYMLYLEAAESDNVVGQVTYVKKGTPAEAAGIKRGMLFYQVNGSALTTTNYNSLLSTTESQLSLGFLQGRYNSDSSAITGLVPGQILTVQTLSNYPENPIYMDSIYEYQNRKVGYLVYNFFAGDDGDGTNAYNLALNRVFGKFRQAGITDLVLDLRYNSGGSAISAEYLASMIVPNLSANNLYSYYEYNAYLNSQYKKEDSQRKFKESIGTEAIENVGDKIGSRLIVLTGPYTASASEQVINGLKPYMEQVVLIGDTTYGKNVASFSLYQKDDKYNKWGMQPIVAKYFNKDGRSDFTAGFCPDFKVEDVGSIAIRQLGDVKENLLNQAFVVLGIFNKTESAQIRSRIGQKNSLLKASSHPIRGLQLNKIPFND